MGALTSTEVYAKIEVLKKCWVYLLDNFHKFNETNKIKIAIALTTKDLPTKVEGDVGGTKVIIVKDKEKNGASNNRGIAVPEAIPGQPE
jgi:hypothetical protein